MLDAATPAITFAPGAAVLGLWLVGDILVVITAWLPLLFPAFTGYTALRALRAFRPLRALHVLPGVRKQVDTILKALPKLGNVVLLVAFVGSAFGTPAETEPTFGCVRLGEHPRPRVCTACC